MRPHRPGESRIPSTSRLFCVQLLFLVYVGHGAVSARMFGEVVATHESFVAVGTLETLFAGVSPDVALQFVRPHEPLAAVQPVADERPFAAVPAQMRLEVRRLGVHLSAAGDVTRVLGGRRRRRGCTEHSRRRGSIVANISSIKQIQ